MPRTDDSMDRLFNKKVISTVDCASGYYQVVIKPEDRHKTAFATPFGLYEFVRMPFGLSNAPATFQRLMDRVMAGLIGEICMVYMDDIIVFSESVEEHIIHLGLVFDRLKLAGLKLKKSKCHFMQKKVKYLGHIVSTDGMMPQERKSRRHNQQIKA